TSVGASIPMRTCLPLMLSMVTVTSSPILIASPDRRDSINMGVGPIKKG
ncbi:MAG: hypothetical protein ACJA0Z_003704, partial [Halioglobus sp.]